MCSRVVTLSRASNETGRLHFWPSGTRMRPSRHSGGIWPAMTGLIRPFLNSSKRTRLACVQFADSLRLPESAYLRGGANTCELCDEGVFLLRKR